MADGSSRPLLAPRQGSRRWRPGELLGLRRLPLWRWAVWPRLRRVGRPATPVLPEPHGEEDQGNERRPYADGEADDDAGGPASPSVGRVAVAARRRGWRPGTEVATMDEPTVTAPYNERSPPASSNCMCKFAEGKAARQLRQIFMCLFPKNVEFLLDNTDNLQPRRTNLLNY